MSTTATRMLADARLHGVGHRLAGQRGEQVVDGEVGHRARAVVVAEPMCGTTSRFGASSSGSSGGSGSGSVTSSAAPAELPVVQRVGERGLVDDRAARRVDEDRRRLHARERGGVDQVARGGGERHVERDDVGAVERACRSSSRAR